jgi:hypothetical protein
MLQSFVKEVGDLSIVSEQLASDTERFVYGIDGPIITLAVLQGTDIQLHCLLLAHFWIP